MTPLETAQKASELTDRALFLCAIIVLAGTFMWFLKRVADYFIKQHAIVVEAHFSERAQCFSEIKKLQDERKIENAGFVRCIDANTKSTDCNTEMLKRVNDRLLERHP